MDSNAWNARKYYCCVRRNLMTQNAINNAGGSSGALVLIQTQTTASATEIDFTTGITSTYNNYLLIGINTVMLAGAPQLGIQISIDGGATYITTNYTSGFSALTTSMDFIVNGGSTTTSIGYNSYTLFNLTSGTSLISGTGPGVSYDPANPPVSSNVVYDAYTIASTTVNALRLIASDGTAFSGTFSLYGYSF